MNLANVLQKIEMSKSSVNLPIETSDDWEKWVTKPVILYPLSPREARAVLELFGFLKAEGINTYTVLMNIVRHYRIIKHKQKQENQ